MKYDRSELCEVCVPLLLHCISLPCGAESLVNEVESTFTNKDWRVRFDGVSKVYWIQFSLIMCYHLAMLDAAMVLIIAF